MEDLERCCWNCRFYEELEGICCSADSEHWADFTELEDCCPEWEAR